MSLRRRFQLGLSGLILVVCLGVVGYMTIEGWSFFDALYMSVVTLSTVGFEEVHDLSTAGRAFSIFLIVTGTGVMLYTLTTVVQYLLEGHLVSIWGRRRMKERISKLKDHVILCGYGLVGREVARVFRSEGTPFVVIEKEPAVVALAAEHEYLCLEGNATSDDMLVEAGIQRARALVTALGSDADNVYVTLSARQMRSDLFIVARAVTEESEPKLRRAGANRTMSPYSIGGRRLAMLTLRPVVVDFVDTTMRGRGGEDLILENVRLTAGSPVAGATVQDSKQLCQGATILAVQKRNGNLLTNPPAQTVLEIGDQLVVIGTRDQLRGLEGSV